MVVLSPTIWRCRKCKKEFKLGKRRIWVRCTNPKCKSKDVELVRLGEKYDE